jgi:hypothetical protein
VNNHALADYLNGWITTAQHISVIVHHSDYPSPRKPSDLHQALRSLEIKVEYVTQNVSF